MSKQTMEAKLLSLGDPSGQKTSAYWNEWFDVVCTSNQKTSFEWYASVKEVARIIAFHFQNDNMDPMYKRRLVHPGSGNSLVPFHLAKTMKLSHHIILDVSDKAIEDCKANFSKEDELQSTSDSSIEYEVVNILQPLPYSPNFFDAWVDKGLLDALFSGKVETKQKDDEQLCIKMFREAHRVLKNESGGIMIIVTMAETHSLNLILGNWFQLQEGRSIWNTTLHIHELIPTSGTRRPFAFVLQKETKVNKNSTDWNVIFHPICDSNNVIDTESNTICVSLTPLKSSSLTVPALSSVEVKVNSLLETSRTKFLTEMDNHSKSNNERNVLGTIEIKPSDDKVDLSVLCNRITQSNWGIDSLHWHKNNVSDDDSTSSHRFGKIVPIGFGIHKLVLKCIIDSNSLDNLCEAIMKQDSDRGECNVQSVDIDWEQTFTVGDLGSIIDPNQWNEKKSS